MDGSYGLIIPLNIRMAVLSGKMVLNNCLTEALNIPMVVRTTQRATLFQSK